MRPLSSLLHPPLSLSPSPSLQPPAPSLPLTHPPTLPPSTQLPLLLHSKQIAKLGPSSSVAMPLACPVGPRLRSVCQSSAPQRFGAVLVGGSHVTLTRVIILDLCLPMCKGREGTRLSISRPQQCPCARPIGPRLRSVCMCGAPQSLGAVLVGGSHATLTRAIILDLCLPMCKGREGTYV